MPNPSIKKNYIYNTIYEILNIIIPLISAPYISRVFEADGVGIYSYTNAIALYFTMFSALGVKSYGQREIAQHRDDPKQASKLFWELEIMCISSTIACLVLWSMLIVFSSAYSAYYAVLTMTIVAVAFDISWFWAGYEEYKFIVIRNSAVKILGLILLFSLITQKSDLLKYIALISATGLLGNISMWTYLPKFLKKTRIRDLQVARHYKQTFIYFIPTIATSIYTLLDKAMIGWITKDDFENGYYEQATKVLSICKALVLSVNTVMSSRMSFLFMKKNHKEIEDKLLTTMSFVLMLSIPMVFGLYGIADSFVPIFFGDGYEKVVMLLYVMSPLIVIISISNCLGALYFTPSGQRSRSNKGIVCGAVVNLILNLTLIPYLASNGAAVASVIAELTITAMYLYMARDYFRISYVWQCSWKRLIASVFMFGVVVALGKLLPISWMTLIVRVCIGSAVYFVLLVLMKDSLVLDNAKKLIAIFGIKRNSR